MNCDSCGGALALASSGSVARCSSCQRYFGIMNGAALAIAVSEAWPTLTRSNQEDDARDREFDAAANAPSPANPLRFIMPVIIVVVMAGVGISIYLSAQSASTPPPFTPPAAAPNPPKPPAVAAPPKKK
jgi:hypothetical protein